MPKPVEESDFPREFALTVGVTGHRNLPPAERDRIGAASAQILADVKNAAGAITVNGREIGVFTREPRLRIASCLSEGADRLVAEVALEAGYSLQGFLPFPRDSAINAMDLEGEERRAAREGLRRLCERAESVVEFSPKFPKALTKLEPPFSPLGDDEFARAYRQDAYLNASVAMLEQSDVLIAVWNGAPQASPGGTYDTITRALSRGVPVCVIDSALAKPVQILGCPEDFLSSPKCPQSIEEIIVNKFGLDSGNLADELIRVKKEISAARNKREPALARALNLFQKATEGKHAAFPAPTIEHGKTDFLIFDDLANRGRARYRASFLGLILTTLPAIAFALLASFAPAENAMIAFAILEAPFLVGAILAMRKAKKEDSLQKPVTYRYVAEILRCSVAAARLGLSCPYENSESFYPKDAHRDWCAYYLRNAIRARGVDSVNYGDPAGLRTRFEEIGVFLLRSQAAYHKRKSREYSRLANFLELIGLGLYLLALAVVGLRFAGTLILREPLFAPLVAFVSVLAPVTALSVLAAVRTADLRRAAARSRNLCLQFTRADELFRKSDAANEKRKIVENVVALMIRDVRAWRDQYN